MAGRRKDDEIEIGTIGVAAIGNLRQSTTDLIAERGIKTKKDNGPFMGVLGIEVIKFGGRVKFEVKGKKVEVSFVAFTTGQNDVVIDASQIKNGERVRLALPDWRPPYFIYPDAGLRVESAAPTQTDIEFYSKVIEAAKKL